MQFVLLLHFYFVSFLRCLRPGTTLHSVSAHQHLQDLSQQYKTKWNIRVRRGDSGKQQDRRLQVRNDNFRAWKRILRWEQNQVPYYQFWAKRTIFFPRWGARCEFMLLDVQSSWRRLLLHLLLFLPFLRFSLCFLFFPLSLSLLLSLHLLLFFCSY